VIKNNLHIYSVSALCKVLQIPKSTYYYEAKQKADDRPLTIEKVDIFKTSRNNYGTRKIKVELMKRRHKTSSRHIGRIQIYSNPIQATPW
jgi:hypothetical protein